MIARIVPSPARDGIDPAQWQTGNTFLIGRHHANPMRIVDPIVSRFHVTIFHHGGDFFLLDHSLNGTWMNRVRPDGTVHTERLDTVMMSEAFRDFCAAHTDGDEAAGDDDKLSDTFDNIENAMDESRRESLFAQTRDTLPKIVGYRPHIFATERDMEALLTMASTEENAAILAAQGRRLEAGDRFTLPSARFGKITLAFEPF